MQMGSESEVVRARRLAVGAFIALSLPLLFVADSTPPDFANDAKALLLPSVAMLHETEAKPGSTHKRILVSLPERRLAVVEKKKVVKSYRIAVGADASPSPTGEFKIVSKVTDPTYYTPGMIVTAGPLNPLGSRWLGLDKEHYGIHGTNEPTSIGQAASHGCIRLAQPDVEELFSLARIGDTVEISDEPLRVLAQLHGAGGEIEAIK